MAVIDKSGDLNEEGGNNDALENEADQKDNDLVDNEAGDADIDGGPEDKEAGKAPGEDEEVKGEPSGDEVKAPDIIRDLQAKVAELEERLKPALAPKREEAPPPQPTQISEEDWAKYEEERGIPRTAQTWITQNMVRLYQDIEKRIDQRFAKLDRDDAVETLTKDPEFSDAKKYGKEIQQYLEKVDPRFHSDPSVLKDAVIWSRGLNFKNGVQKARDEKEINKRISGAARPASPGASRGGTKQAPKLTALQKSAAEAVNMSESEYASLLGKGRVIAK